MDKIIYGGDTETIKGLPMTMQFYSEDVACSDIFFVSAATAADTFLKWCAKRRRNVSHVVYVHFLSFDLPEFLWGHHAKLVGPGGDFDFKLKGWNIKGVYGTPTFCRVSNGHDITVTIVDSYSFYRGTLAKGAELFCPDLPKLKRPQGLGEKLFTKKDENFCEYSMRDAVVAYHIGKSIERMHQEYDLQQCVSIADMASRVFRHRFLDYTIPQPGRDIVDAALLSYHGGKNNITTAPGWYENIASIDISSAYPAAMRLLPAFSNARLYKRYLGKRIKAAHPHGVYCVSGRLDPCAWPVLFSHGFKPLSGEVDRVWVQGHELNEAISSGEFRPTKVKGFYYDSEHDNQAPAFRNFVDTFYALKEKEKDPVLRYMQKTILNSLYGKFIQTRKRGTSAYTDIDAGVTVTASELVAGGMFHPFIASDITAEPRARIHRLEHKHKALHTATDGIMFVARGTVHGVGRGVGSLTVEAQNATLLLIRNKCYVLYTKKGKKTTPSFVFKGKHILKYAKHGFQGSVTELERLVATGRRKYTVEKPNRLKESLKRKLTPNLFVKREYTLKVPPMEVRKPSFPASSRTSKPALRQRQKQ